MKLKVKFTKTSEIVEIDIESSSTIKEVKQKVFESNLKLTVESQKLIYQGKILTDDKSLSFYNISEGLCLIVLGKVSDGTTSVTSSAGNTTTSAPTPTPAPVPSVNTFPAPTPSTTNPTTTASVTIPHPDHPLQKALTDLRAKPQNDTAKATTAIKTLLTICKNIIDKPHEEKYRSMKKANSKFNERLGGLPGAPECLIAVGFSDESEAYVLSPSEEGWNKLVQSREILEATLKTIAPAPIPNVNTNPPPLGVGILPGFGTGLGGANLPGLGAGLGGGNMPDMAAVSQMMQNPLIQQQMTQMLSNPQAMQGMIQQMRAVNPSAAAQMEQMLPMLQNPMVQQHMQEMMANPQAMQQQMNAAQDMMRNMGMGQGLGGFGGLSNLANNNNNNNGGQATGNNNNNGNANNNGNNQNQQMTEEDMINEAIARSLREM